MILKTARLKQVQASEDWQIPLTTTAIFLITNRGKCYGTTNEGKRSRHYRKEGS